MRVSVSNLPIKQWVSARKYADIHDLRPQTLANWRYQDRKAGRNGAAPGYPQYRRFGGAIRYCLTDEPERPAAPTGGGDLRPAA